MEVIQVKNRSVVLRSNMAEWDLNLHVILGSRYNYVIDTGLGSLSVQPVKELLRNGPRPVVVVNTHYHWDHVWGNCAFPDSVIVSHRLCRERIASRWDAMLERNGRFLRGDARMCLPNLVFEDSLYFPDDGIRLLYTPGHTTDSISVLDEEDGVLNAGDNVGDTQDEILPSIETERDAYMGTIAKYKALDFDVCVSGHNVVLGKEIFDTILRSIPE